MSSGVMCVRVSGVCVCVCGAATKVSCLVDHPAGLVVIASMMDNIVPSMLESSNSAEILWVIAMDGIASVWLGGGGENNIWLVINVCV